jgi:type IV pilus assembly protein PilC
LQKIIASLVKDAESGVFLSNGLAKFKNVFGDLFINIIKVAEVSGTLPENLIYLGDELKKKSDLQKKVRGAMIYPIIILIATVIIATTMIVFVFPKILPLFQGVKGDLPITTRILIGFSEIISAYGIFLLTGIILFIAGLRFLFTFPVPKYLYHRFLFFVPVFGSAIIKYNMANFSRTLGLLLRSGVKIIEAINITSASTANRVYRRELDGAANYVRTGEYLSKYLVKHPSIFPATLVNMIEVGENTGNLTANLFYLAEYYESEVDDFVRNISSVIEPILLLFMGGIVGFIALSFITPIYQLTKQF